MKLLAPALVLLAGAVRPPVPGDDPTPTLDAGALVLSVEAVQHIVEHETGGRAYYGKFYERPQDPGFSSGVTVGFGYDLRFHTPAEIRQDWAGVATPGEILAMVSVAGKDGSLARSIRSKVRITWDEARVVFDRVTLPRWAARTRSAYAIASPRALHPHLNGALTGNTFNRGTSMAGDRSREKRAIRSAIAAGKWSSIPALFDSQARLWPSHAGLQRRRHEEADLARKALQHPDWQ